MFRCFTFKYNKDHRNTNNDSKNIQSISNAIQIILVEFNQEIAIDELKRINNVENVVKQSANTYLFSSKAESNCRLDIAEYAAANNKLILQMQIQENNLEAIFKELTK